MPEVRGRGRRRPYAEVRIEARSLLIRVDDADDPEFWIEIKLESWELCNLYREMRQKWIAEVMDACPDPSEVPDLDDA